MLRWLSSSPKVLCCNCLLILMSQFLWLFWEQQSLYHHDLVLITTTNGINSKRETRLKILSPADPTTRISYSISRVANVGHYSCQLSIKAQGAMSGSNDSSDNYHCASLLQCKTESGPSSCRGRIERHTSVNSTETQYYACRSSCSGGSIPYSEYALSKSKKKPLHELSQTKRKSTFLHANRNHLCVG